MLEFVKMAVAPDPICVSTFCAYGILADTDFAAKTLEKLGLVIRVAC